MYPKKWKCTKKAISLMTAFAMLSSTIEAAAISVSAEIVGSDTQAIVSEKSSQPAGSAQSTTQGESGQVVPDTQPDTKQTPQNTDQGTQPTPQEVTNPPVEDAQVVTSPAIEPTKPDKESGAQMDGVPNYQEAYDKMIALETEYPEGKLWTNFEPYGTRGELGSAYKWKGGPILNNVTSGVGCAAFAFILSDAAFDTLPARVINRGSFKYEDVNVGDILRINGNSHSVIVLQKNDAGVVIAEGNYNKSVHWRRVLSKQEVEAADFIVTRYPKGYSPTDIPGADEVADSGTTGNLKWELTKGGTLTISGNGGVMPDFSTESLPPWNTHNDKIHSIIIEDSITSIGAYAFYQSKASSIHIANSVTSIGQSAFYKSELMSVTIPGSVKTIGNDAFYINPNLFSVTVSEGVETIGERAFYGGTSLQYIDFPASVTAIGAAAFSNCKITSVRFMPGDQKVTIGDNLFMECQYLTDVTLPKGADCISASMFAGCISLQKLYIPAGITSVKGGAQTGGGGPFMNCAKLMEINFSGSKETWRQIGGENAMTYSGKSNDIVKFDVEFPDPFEQEPNDPGDLIIGDHMHNWSSTEWSHDETSHWHECSAQGCPVTDNSAKGSYAQHSFGDWVTDANATSSQSGSKHRDCTVCAYRQTESIPATGGSSGSGGSSSGGSGSGGSSGGSWGGGSGSGGSWGGGSSSGGSSGGGSVSPTTPSSPVSPSNPVSPTGPDSTGDNPGGTDDNTGSSDNNSGNGDNSSDSNTNGGDTDNSGSSTDPDNTGNSNNAGNKQKQQKTKFKKQLKTDLNQQIKAKLKIKLKKQLQSELKPQSKAKLKKQLKAKLKPQLKAKLKKQLKKQFGKTLGKDFTSLFNEQFQAQYDKIFNEQFRTQYKRLASKQKKR